jgi:hypothetical protein
MILDVHPGFGSWFFTHPGSLIHGSKRHRILDPDRMYFFIDNFADSKMRCTILSLHQGLLSSSRSL